jgi:hypothetical protein
LTYVDKYDLEKPFIVALRKQNPSNIRLQQVAAKVEAQLALPDDGTDESSSAEHAAAPDNGGSWSIFGKRLDTRIIIGAAAGILVLIVILAVVFWPDGNPPPVDPLDNEAVVQNSETNTSVVNTPVNTPVANNSAANDAVVADLGPETLEIGQAADGSPISAIRLGAGDNVAIFVGGFHAGYSPSSGTIAQRAAIELAGKLPETVKVYIIPNANPTSEYAPGVRSSRLNANGVDINRNWDCEWSAEATFSGLPIGSGSAPFSEPEVQALKSLVESVAPQAVVVWGARARSGLVAPGGCERETQISVPLALAYSRAAGYSLGTFDPDNTVPGDVTNWLASQGIPAIYVLTPDYVDPDWPDNLRGIEAVLDWLK